jgi:hypothetical protein
MRGEIAMKNFFGLKSKVPLLPNLDQTYTACGACGDSAMPEIWDTLMQFKVR